MMNLPKYSMLGILIRLFKLGRYIFDCWRPTAVYAALITLIALIMRGIGTECIDADGGWCGIILQNWFFIPLFVLGTALYTHLFLAFAVDFYDEVFMEHKFTFKQLWRRSKEKWHQELFLLGYFLGFLLSFALVLKLLMQPANPNWRIEMVYFSIIFGLFVFILFLMRIAAAVSRYLSTGHSDWRQIYKQTSGRAYAGIILFLLILALILLCSLRLNIWFNVLSSTVPLLTALFCFIKIFMQLIFTALMLTFYRAQDELLKVVNI